MRGWKVPTVEATADEEVTEAEMRQAILVFTFLVSLRHGAFGSLGIYSVAPAAEYPA